MTPGKFLRLIWPSTGFYCIAHPFKPEGSATTVYAHKVFDNISAAVTHVHETIHTADTFFAVLSMREEKVWDPTKTNYKDGTKGAWATRLQTNMLASKCLFFDLDVGSEANKYPTQRDALAGLLDFLDKTKLPMPMLVSSGGGVHVYWPFDADVALEDWTPMALHMRQLAEALGLKIDTTRTTDSSSVLRVVGTFNWKDRSNPREVKALQEGAPTPVATIQQIISDAMITYSIQPQTAPTRAVATLPGMAELGTQEFKDFGPAPTLGEVAAACGQVSEMLRSQGDPTHPHYGQLDNTAWYRGMICTIGHVEDGEDWCRKITAQHPRTVANIEAKLLQMKQFAPARCETIAQFMPWKDVPCQSCRFRGKVPNPLAATRKHTVAPPPGLQAVPPAPTATSSAPASSGAGNTAQAAPVAPSMLVQAAMIPNPPWPFERLKSGGISINRTDKDGNTSSTTIYAHDLYPLKRMTSAGGGAEQQTWRAKLPRQGDKDFTIDADVLYDGRKFAAALANNGIYPEKANLPAMQDYMVAYISQLQRDLDADNQTTALGWCDDYQQFVLPDKTLLSDGTVRNAALTDGAKRATQFLGRKGDLASQVRLLDFYNHDGYIPNQFAIIASLASIIFYMTGHHGMVINMSGESGASKSTTLYTASSMWGSPKLWPINGTNRGATANARSQRIATNGNLPTLVDEITHLPARDAIDLAMSISQPGHRLRLGQDGQEKAGSSTDGYKAALMITTANSSLHALLSTDNAAGTAGSMRVFEMKCVSQGIHTKAQADDFLRELEQHYGWIGEIVAAFVIKHRHSVEHRIQTVMREIDAEAAIQSSERYWSAAIAAVCVMGEITEALRLLPFSVAKVRQWAVTQQVPYMRGVVREEYRDPLAVLTDYMAEKSGNMIVIERSTSIGANTTGTGHVASSTDYAQVRPHGALLGHYDVKAGVLYLLKQGFKDHCSRVGASSTRIIEELSTPRAVPHQGAMRIITNKHIRRTLGAGTDLAKGQAWCFAVDMTHPDIAGAKPVLVASNANTPAAAAGATT